MNAIPQSTHSSPVSPPPPLSYSPPPVSPVSSVQPTIKKKRRRVDAAQLKVLNETYNRTSFPRTEERLALAKTLDMSARSVQIWFQNKRQSTRQRLDLVKVLDVSTRGVQTCGSTSRRRTESLTDDFPTSTFRREAQISRHPPDASAVCKPKMRAEAGPAHKCSLDEVSKLSANRQPPPNGICACTLMALHRAANSPPVPMEAPSQPRRSVVQPLHSVSWMNKAPSPSRKNTESGERTWRTRRD